MRTGLPKWPFISEALRASFHAAATATSMDSRVGMSRAISLARTARERAEIGQVDAISLPSRLGLGRLLKTPGPRQVVSQDATPRILSIVRWPNHRWFSQSNSVA